MRRQLVALTFVAIPLAVVLANAQGSRPAAAPRSVELDALDKTTEPCTDFYQYACGGWIAKNPIPADRRSIGRFAEVQERNFLILRRILETTPPDTGPSDRKRAADYYAACMDDAAIENKGLVPLAHDLATIDALVNPDDLPILVAYLHTIGVPAFFRFNAQTDLRDATQSIADVDQGGLSLPDRDYYLKTDARSEEIREQVRGARGAHLPAGRTVRRKRRPGEPVGHVSREQAGPGRTRSREAARSGPDSASDDRRRTAAHQPGVRLEALRGGVGGAEVPGAQRVGARVRQGVQRADRVDAGGRSQGLPALASDQCVRRDAAEEDCGCRFRFLQPYPGRPAATRAALAPVRDPDRPAARRSARQGVRRRSVRRPGEERRAEDGAGHQERDAAGHRCGALDERRDEEGGDGQAGSGRRSHRLSGKVA